mgnify:FL=1
MKIHLLIIGSFLLIYSCQSKSNGIDSENKKVTEEISEDEKELTGKFSFDGKSVTGDVTTQYFGDKVKGNFSVLCQHNEGDYNNPNFELLQVTFINEKDATTSILNLYHGSMLPMTEPESGSVTVSLSGVGNGLGDLEYTGSSKSTGTIEVKNRTIIIKSLKLFNSDGASKEVNAEIPF